MPITDEYTLLCETCGYTVDGLPAEGNCPECGRAIRTSLPEARAGTPWDRGPSVRSWFATGWMVVRRPRRTFESTHISRVRLSSLFLTNAVIAASAAIAPATAISVWGVFGAALGLNLPWHYENRATEWLLITPLAWFGGVLLILVLTEIERIGLRIIGGRHRWRITRAITVAVCEHASYGWVIAGVLVGVASFPIAVEPRLWRNLLGSGWQFWVLGGYPAAMLAGLLIFETLVYIGVRRCKFANRARPALEAALPGPSPATQPPA